MRTLMNKRGQILDLTGQTVVGVMVLIFLIFAVLYGIATLNPAGFFTSGSSEANSTANLQRNLTSGIDQFGGNLPTVFKIIGIVLALSAIVILIVYVRRMSATAGSGGGL
jgi:hypothetical protein